MYFALVELAFTFNYTGCSPIRVWKEISWHHMLAIQIFLSNRTHKLSGFMNSQNSPNHSKSWQRYQQGPEQLYTLDIPCVHLSPVVEYSQGHSSSFTFRSSRNLLFSRIFLLNLMAPITI